MTKFFSSWAGKLKLWLSILLSDRFRLLNGLGYLLLALALLFFCYRWLLIRDSNEADLIAQINQAPDKYANYSELYSFLVPRTARAKKVFTKLEQQPQTQRQIPYTGDSGRSGCPGPQ